MDWPNQGEKSLNFFSFLRGTSVQGNAELPEIYPFGLALQQFVKADMLATYSKILTDTVERTHGLDKKLEPLLWDNCVQNQSQEGLIDLVANAMVDKRDLYIVYKPSVQVLRQADRIEAEQIKRDYEQKGESPLGVYISFTKYRRTDMLRIYSELEYCILASLHKTVNLSKAVQVKIDKLRESVSLSDAEVGRIQAKSIAEALGRGSDVLLDAGDSIETSTPDISPTEKAITFLDTKRSFILGLPTSYISGIQTPGIGSTGEADMRAVERGLKQYFISIVQPVIKAIFGIDPEFKSQDFRQMTSALEALRTFDLVSDENLSRKSKREIVARMFDVDPGEEEKALADEEKERDAEEPEVVVGIEANSRFNDE
jgi:hypothetical protein